MTTLMMGEATAVQSVRVDLGFVNASGFAVEDATR